MAVQSETVEGYVVDIACIRKYARDELLERARTHTRACSTMGHCIESGYGLIDERDRVYVLDAKATPQVLDAIERSEQDRGIRLRVTRTMENGEMETANVEPLSAGTNTA